MEVEAMSKETGALALRPENFPELKTREQRNAEALAVLRTFELASPEDLAHAGDVLVRVKADLDLVDSWRKRAKAPSLEEGRKVDAFFAPALDGLKEAETLLKSKIAAYTIARDAARVAALPAVAAGTLAPADALAPVEQAAGVSVITKWEPAVTNADAVPREYCSPDLEKIRATGWYADTEHTPPLPIPGVTWVRVGAVRASKGKAKR